MTIYKKLSGGFFGAASLFCLTSAQSGSFTDAIETENREVLLGRCYAGLKATAEKLESPKRKLWENRTRVLLEESEHEKKGPLESSDKEKLRSLKAPKPKVENTPISTIPEPSVEELEKQLRTLQLKQQVAEARRKLVEEETLRLEAERQLKQQKQEDIVPTPVPVTTAAPPVVPVDSQQQLLFGRPPERVQQNINTEIQRGAESFVNLISGKGWKHNKKLKKGKLQ